MRLRYFVIASIRNDIDFDIDLDFLIQYLYWLDKIKPLSELCSDLTIIRDVILKREHA